MAPEVQLSDLIATGLIEPDGRYLYSPREQIDDHEMQTATMLAERLKRSVVLLPRLNKWVAVPAVDGIMFNQEGRPTHNFSIKTFVPPQSGYADSNKKLLGTMRVARQGIERHYDLKRWQEIVRKYFPRSIANTTCMAEAEIYAKIFGLTNGRLRPVSVVIDYTRDPTAEFRLHMRSGSQGPHVYLSLNDYDNGLNVLHLMERIRTHSVVKEYIFLGTHHLLSIRENGYEMTEFCDSFGHDH
jgi:hypothetical protein